MRAPTSNASRKQRSGGKQVNVYVTFVPDPGRSEGRKLPVKSSEPRPRGRRARTGG